MNEKPPEAYETRIAELERENEKLRSAIRQMWPVVTKHTPVSFWGPIEIETRNADRRRQ